MKLGQKNGRMNKCIWLICFILVVSVSFVPVVAKAATAAPPSTIAEAAVLIDADTGTVLFEKNPNKWMHPASLTKMVTLLVAIEKKGTSFDQLATLSSNAVGTEPSSLGFSVNDELSLQGLATGMVVVSGNDAAVAIAENVSGSVPAFVTEMNALAKRAGAMHTNFVNPHGLTQWGQQSTALDLAKIAAYGMKIPMFRDMVGYDNYYVSYQNRKGEWVQTTNLFRRTNYEGVNGIKTGYTQAAGDCLVASATRGGRTLIVVFMNDDNRWTDAPAFLDYGFTVLGIHP